MSCMDVDPITVAVLDDLAAQRRRSGQWWRLRLGSVSTSGWCWAYSTSWRQLGGCSAVRTVGV
ncbi:MAG: hypothetical protein GY788_07870 [bacterium]|nr:hypothetical protein [bacterium]